MRKLLILVFCLILTLTTYAETITVGIDPEGNNVQIGVEPKDPLNIETKANSDDDFIYYDCIPLPEEVQHYIWNSCKNINLDYCYALAIMEQESTFRQYAKHSNNNGSIDKGLWQINSSNISALKKAGVIESTDDLFDVYKCTDAAMWELAPLVAKYGNSEQLYAAYNTGKSNIKSNRNSRKVMTYWSEWKNRLNKN